MYYRLKEPWAFRGWKRTPYAIQAMYGKDRHKRPHFFNKDVFLELLDCNGEEVVELSGLSEKTQHIVKEFLEHDIMEQSEMPMTPLQSWQRYHVFPARYMESVHWSITGKCNFRCRHCLVSAPDAHLSQLPMEDCLRIIREIAKCGIRRVDITGGEPLVRSDFEEIVGELSRFGIEIGTLFTNASLLTEAVLKMLLGYHQRPAIQISFDGLGHHDWLRGVEGAEAQADTAFRLLRKYEFPVSATMCIHRENKDSLRDTVNYLAGLGVRSLRINAPQKLGLWKQYAEEYALSEDEVWEAYKSLIGDYFADGMPLDIEMDGYFSCKKGETGYKIPYVRHTSEGSDWSRIPMCESVRYNMYIGNDGRVLPCMGFADTAISQKFPCVLKEPLGKLTLEGYYHDVAETRISDYLKKNPECVECKYLAKCCGGCMVQDITDDGDYLVPDRRICYFHKHIGEAAVHEVADAAILRTGDCSLS
ncbi:MAG: radical SAM protein [Lachnospiraceae bacterium]|nr:radical SAM protein [Lachnospiraceae bacterium]